jgi:DNA-binding response OmpR family regulator
MNTSLPTILVLDDEPDLLEFLSLLLVDEGYRVKIVQAAEELQHYLDEGELPALFVLDLLLSGSNGGELVRQLKNAERTKGIPILMVSAHPSAEQQAYAGGAEAFLAKPFEIDDFLALVGTLIARQSAEPAHSKDQERTYPDLLTSPE